MKNRFLLPLILLILTLLCTTASAASLLNSSSIPGQAPISSVYDAYGMVDALTDGGTHTTWTSDGYSNTTLTFNTYYATVGEIWVRNGHCYSQNYYNHYDRPDVIRVTVWYQANQYSQSYDTYRYRMSDAFRPNTTSADWNSGYQRMLLPKQYQNVMKIELTVESTTSGFGQTGATLTDVVLAAGEFATATPRTYATNTPRPYTVYVTPTPRPYNPDDYIEYFTPEPTDREEFVEFITPEPDVWFITPKPTSTPLVELITPEPDVWLITPKPTGTPLVELITPKPTAEPIDYPTRTGIVAALNKRMATRSGPGVSYDEPGSFFSAGDQVNVINKSWDDENAMWWFQVEFFASGEWYRAYTPASRVEINPDYVPTEPYMSDPREVLYNQRVYFGPGEEYKMYKVSMLYKGSRVVICAVEDDWVQIEYRDYSVDEKRRGWVPVEVLSQWQFEW